MNRKWYMDVGGKLVTALITMTFSPHLIALAKLPLMRVLALGKAKIAKMQRDAKAAFKGPVFQLMPKYASAAAFCFIGLIYSSGMPVLYLLIAIILLGWHYSDKYLLLRFHSRPIPLDSSLNSWVA